MSRSQTPRRPSTPVTALNVSRSHLPPPTTRSISGALPQILRLVDPHLDLHVDTQEALLVTRSVLRQLCQSFRRLNATGSLDAFFETPGLSRLAGAAADLPHVAAAVVESFLNEDLHRFLTENQMERIAETFPDTFCRGEDIWNYFNGSRELRNFRDAFCSMNISAIVAEDFLPILHRIWADVNETSSLSSIRTLGDIIEYGGCIADNALVVDWQRLLDLSPIERSRDSVADYPLREGAGAW